MNVYRPGGGLHVVFPHAAEWFFAMILKGSITALIGVDWKGDRVFAAGNGSVDLQILADSNVTVVANAFRGDVAGMFGMASGTLGDGGRRLRLIAGNVSLRQAPAGGQ